MAADPNRPLNWAAQLRADQQRERESTATQQPDVPFLGLRTRSYTQTPEPTEEEDWQEEQRGMQETAQRFSAPGTERLGSEPRTADTRPARDESPLEVGHQEVPAGSPDLSRAQQLRQAVQQDRARVGREASRVQQTVSDTQQKVKNAQRLWRIVQGVETATLVGIILVLLQLNAQVINKYFFKRSSIPATSFPEDVGCACFNCAFLAMFFLGALVAFFPFLIAWIAVADPGDIIRTLLEDMLGKLFG